MLTITDTQKFLAEQLDLSNKQNDKRELLQGTLAQLHASLSRTPSLITANDADAPQDLAAQWSSLVKNQLVDTTNPREFLSIFLSYTRTAAHQIQDTDKRKQFIELMATTLHQKFHSWANRHGGWKEAYESWETELAATEQFLMRQADLVRSLDDETKMPSVMVEIVKKQAIDLAIANLVKAFLSFSREATEALTDISLDPDQGKLEEVIYLFKQMRATTDTSENDNPMGAAITLMLYCHADRILTDTAKKAVLREKIAAGLHRVYYHRINVDEHNGWENALARQIIGQNEMHQLSQYYWKSLLVPLSTAKNYLWSGFTGIGFFATRALSYVSGSQTVPPDNNPPKPGISI